MTRPWPEKYLSAPFVDGGRDAKGFDCWGLVALVMQNECAIPVPNYGEISASELVDIARQMEADTKGSEIWVRVIVPREFDVAVMSWFGKKIIGHVGIMLDERRILHTEKGAGVMVVDKDHDSIRRRIRGFYRHRKLVNVHAV